MSDKPENPLAFPSHPPYEASGMTLRDYFAGQALAGLAFNGDYHAENRAREAYEYADAMLKERTNDK